MQSDLKNYIKEVAQEELDRRKERENLIISLLKENFHMGLPMCCKRNRVYEVLAEKLKCTKSNAFKHEIKNILRDEFGILAIKIDNHKMFRGIWRDGDVGFYINDPVRKQYNIEIPEGVEQVKNPVWYERNPKLKYEWKKAHKAWD